MPKVKKTAAELVASAVAKAPKKGLTASDIAKRVNVPLNTVRLILGKLVKEGTASILGKSVTGERGRPSNIYGKTA